MNKRQQDRSAKMTKQTGAQSGTWVRVHPLLVRITHWINAMAKDGMGKDAMKKDGMKKDAMKKDDMKK